MKIVILVEAGLIQEIYGTDEDVDIEIHDLDNNVNDDTKEIQAEYDKAIEGLEQIH